MSPLAVTGLSVEKGGKPILRDVTFTAPPSAVTALVGTNGAGKSTLLTALLGLASSTGSASFDGQDLPHMSRRDRARIAAYVEQSSNTEERLSVRDVVALGRIPFQPAWATDATPDDDSIIAEALAETGMSTFAARRFDTLSGGEQQRVHVARALAQQPRLLLLDEPTSHLDISAQLQFLFLLRRKALSGATILIALHDLNLAARFCDHLVVLQAGRVLAEGSPVSVLTPELISSVWNVRATLLPVPDRAYPLIVYDGAEQDISTPNSH